MKFDCSLSFDYTWKSKVIFSYIGAPCTQCCKAVTLATLLLYMLPCFCYPRLPAVLATLMCYIQSWTKYMGETPVFMWNSAVRKNLISIFQQLSASIKIFLIIFIGPLALLTFFWDENKFKFQHMHRSATFLHSIPVISHVLYIS